MRPMPSLSLINKRTCNITFTLQQMIGLAKGALENAVSYTHEREAFGKKIADFQVSIDG